MLELTFSINFEITAAIADYLRSLFHDLELKKQKVKVF